MAKAIVVFTWEPQELIVQQRGTQRWYVRPASVNQCEFVVCIRNAHPPQGFKPGPEPHGKGFLVGRISGTVAAGTYGSTERHLIAISEYAEIAMPRLRDKMRGQNPVSYSTLEDLGINLAALDFKPVSASATPPPTQPPDKPEPPVASVSQLVSEAKKALAQKLGVDPEQIEISVRWRSALVV